MFVVATRLVTISTSTSIGAALDRTNRFVSMRLAIVMQALGVTISIGAASSVLFAPTLLPALSIAVMVGFGSILCTIGAGTVENGLNSDWTPTIANSEPSLLSWTNVRVARAYTIAETFMPVLVGALFAGFSADKRGASICLIIVGICNLLSFVVEYRLLSGVYNHSRGLHERVYSSLRQAWHIEIGRALHVLHRLGVAPMVIGFALICFTVASPHGILFTAYFSDVLLVSDFNLGLIRGLGAGFGILATYLFSPIMRRYSLITTAIFASTILAVSIIIAAALLFAGGAHLNQAALITVVGLILVSRIGVYGFALAERQFRQMHVPEGSRGLVGGCAAMLQNIAIIAIYLLAAVLSSPDWYPTLAIFTAVALCCAFGAVVIQRFTLPHQ